MTRKLPWPVCMTFCDDVLVDPKTAEFHLILVAALCRLGMFRLLAVRFLRPGIYRFQLVCENQTVCERSLFVILRGGNGDV